MNITTYYREAENHLFGLRGFSRIVYVMKTLLILSSNGSYNVSSVKPFEGTDIKVQHLKSFLLAPLSLSTLLYSQFFWICMHMHSHVTMRSLLLLALSTFWKVFPVFSLPTRLPGNSFGVPGNASFDYVVIGGGTAGLVIATRLAADPSLSVAVVEAGAFYEIDNGNISVIPGDATFYSGTAPNNTQPLVDWGFDTVPQLVCPSPL